MWWALLLGALAGILPVARPTPAARIALGLLAAFTAWNALACTWTLSTERSLQELSRVVGYLGVVLLGTVAVRDRERALRRVVDAVALAAVIVAALAVLSRLRPGTFSSARNVAALLPGTSGRLAWPLDYWNALAAMMALGVPLLLSIAGSARAVTTRALAAGALPLLALCGYLTFSRGGAIEAGVGLVVFLLGARDRLPKLATILAAAGASALLVLDAGHRHAVERGLGDGAARHQGAGLLLLTGVACGLVAVIQVGIVRLEGRRTNVGHRGLPQRGRRLLVAGVVALGLLAAAGLGAPHRVARAWSEFKRPDATLPSQTTIGRFGAASGEGTLRLLESCDRREQRPCADGVGAGDVPAAVAATGAD